MKKIYLKVDIDTHRGFREGVPILLEIMRDLDVHASFYLAMGPDNSGRAVRRILRKGFLKKMNRTNAWQTYGIPTLLYGVLWPGPMISTSEPALMKQIVREGHELGIHGYDHVQWHDTLVRMSPDRIRRQLDSALEIYRETLHRDPAGFAAPGWSWTQGAQDVFASYPFQYTSNTRGDQVCFPAWGQRRYDLLEIPTTLPTLDEVLGMKATGSEELWTYYERAVEEKDLRVFCLHAELEGLHHSQWFLRMLKTWKDRGYAFGTLEELARDTRKDGRIPARQVISGTVEGRATDVALV